MDRIKQLIEDVYPQVISWRRDFHMYPELSGEEERTAAKIVEILRQLPLTVAEGVGGYGVVGLLKGGKEGKTIALRADIDALPIHEQNDHDFASQHPGKMHACGHDGHTATLLGTAMVLSAMKEEIEGNIKFIFQPAEEKAPIGGAKPMIEAGVLDNPKVDAILGMHIWPNLPKGKVGLKEDALMASSDPFSVEIFGQSGHAAAPHEAVDALLTACQVVNLLQTIVSRNVDPLESAVVTVGTLQSGAKYNIIADYAKIEGTVRTLNPVVQQNMEKRIKEVVEGVCQSTGARAIINYQHGYPILRNNRTMIGILRQVGQKILKDEDILMIQKPTMGGEDFANYLQHVPGAFFWLGAEKEEFYPIHHPRFDFNEEIMKIGMEFFIRSAFDFLGKEEQHG